jgi:hypothetical protein
MKRFNHKWPHIGLMRKRDWFRWLERLFAPSGPGGRP